MAEHNRDLSTISFSFETCLFQIPQFYVIFMYLQLSTREERFKDISNFTSLTNELNEQKSSEWQLKSELFMIERVG